MATPARAGVRRSAEAVLRAAEAEAARPEPLPDFTDATTPTQWLSMLRGLRRSASRILVVVYLFAGYAREGDVEWWLRNMASSAYQLFLTSLDACRNAEWGLGAPRVVDVILTAVREGLIDALLAGPPCSTWSRARWNAGSGTARPLRGRSSHAWGLPYLLSREQRRVREANSCML